MPVNTPREEYSKKIDRWATCRAVVDGSDAVKAGNTTYLPQVSKDQSAGDYKAYLNRATFYNASGATVDGLVGTVMAKEPDVAMPDHVATAIKPHLQDLTRSEENLVSLASWFLQELLIVGRVGVLLELPVEQSRNQRPYWVTYKTEQIVNWRAARRDGDTKLTRIVLQEWVEQSDPDDPFVVQKVEQYRQLELVDYAVADGRVARQYEVTLWRKKEKRNKGDEDEWIEFGPTLIPTRHLRPLDEIPFIGINPDGLSLDIMSPPCADLVDMNLSHYRSSADLENGRHWTSLPTPYVTGVKEGTELTMGSSTAWIIPPADAKVGMLEYTGQGLSTLEKALEQKERLMITLGARLLEQPGDGGETATAVRIRHGGSHASLKRIALSVSQGLTMAWQWHCYLCGFDVQEEHPELVGIALNLEFFSMDMTAAEVRELVTSWQARGMSYETLFWNLKRGGRIPPDRTIEEERALIDAEEDAAEPPAPPDLDDDDDIVDTVASGSGNDTITDDDQQ